ncbi:MAG: hypothetical protein AAF351_13800 [Pseudomonadota bacterium]
MRILFLFGCVASLAWASTSHAHDGDEHDFSGPWYGAAMFLVGRDNFGGEVKEEAKGYTIHTTAEKKSLGAAFRCDKGRLYTYIVVKPVNIHEMISWRTRQPRRWPVEFSLDGSETIAEEWVSIHSAKVYLVVNKATARRIFDLAENGLTIEVNAKSAKPVTVEIPADTEGYFDSFRQNCGFRHDSEST